MPKKDASKAEFVRGLPPTLPAKEVVEKAKEAGLKLTTAYVYVIRSQARTGRKKGSTAGAAAAPHAPPHAPGKRTSNKGAESQLLAAASELGLSRSITLLQREKERVVRMLR